MLQYLSYIVVYYVIILNNTEIINLDSQLFHTDHHMFVKTV